MSRRRLLTISLVTLMLSGGFLTLRSAPDEPEDVKALAKEKAAIARRQYDNLERLIESPPSELKRPDDFEGLALWSRRWAEAESEFGDRAAAIRAHEQRLRTWEDRIVKSGNTNQADIETIRFHRLDAESDLAKLKAK